MRLLIDNVAAMRAGQPPRSDDKLMLALAAILEDAALEPAFVALALVPPGEGDIAREIGHDIDPDAIFQARADLRVEIGERLGAPLSNVYERMTVPGALLARRRERRPPRPAQCRARSAGGKRLDAGHCARRAAI